MIEIGEQLPDDQAFIGFLGERHHLQQMGDAGAKLIRSERVELGILAFLIDLRGVSFIEKRAVSSNGLLPDTPAAVPYMAGMLAGGRENESQE